MTFLALQQLQRRRLTHIVNIFLIGQAVQTDTAYISQTLFLHNLVDTIQHEIRHAVIGLHGLIDNLGQRGIVTNKKPRINADAMTANARTRLQNVYARMHIADLDDFIDIHVVMAADLRQLVCKGNIDCTESILNDLGHLSSTDVGNNDLALAERRIELLHLFTDSLVICADGAVVVQQFVDHVARDDALRSMDKVDILTNLKAICLNHRADILVDSSRRNSRLHDNRCALRADTHDILHGLDNVAGINLLAELVIRSRNRHDVGICNLILGGELYTSCQSVLEQLIQSLFLKSGLARIQSCNQFLIVVSTDNFHTVRSHHQSSRQTNVAQANYVNHFSFLRLLLQQFM